MWREIGVVMDTIELHRLGMKTPISLNIGALISYEPLYAEHCRILMYGNGESSSTGSEIVVSESYDEVKELLDKQEFMRNQDTIALNVGINQYLDFLQHTESNPLRDEYLRWKGMKKIVSDESVTL